MTGRIALIAALLAAPLHAQKPELFSPGVISTADYELNAAFSATGDTILFTRSTFGHWLMTVFMGIREGNSWRTEVAPFSGMYSDVDAIFTPDGRAILFISNRPLAAGDSTTDFNVWRTERTATGWSDAHPLPAPINGDGDDYYPAEAANGVLYFSTSRNGIGRFDIYRSRRLASGAYTPPELLPATVNSTGNDIDLYVDPAERFIIFTSYGRSDALGSGDLYVSFRCAGAFASAANVCAGTEGEWSQAENLGSSVNSRAREYTPFVYDGYLYFTSERNFRTGIEPTRLNQKEWLRRMQAPGNGNGDIYRIPLRDLPIFARMRW